MGPRLIIVSNRVAVPEPGNKQTVGGLVVAVKAALRNRTGVWFGWSGKIDETETAEPRIVQRNHIAYAVIDLSKNDFEEIGYPLHCPGVRESLEPGGLTMAL
jgi:trehalose 6-phosphate synthase